MGTITLSEKQQRRAEVLRRAASGSISIEQAACLLGVTGRQVRRLVARFQDEGLPSVVHGNTGRAPANRTLDAVRARVAELAGKDGKYCDFNTCHMQELLAEHDDVQIGRSTLDRLLVQGGVRKRKRSRPRRVFHRRERVGKEGEMLLTDGSPHDWLEGRDARYRRLCLLGAVDDATSKIVHLRFWPTECQAGYITMAREVTQAFGIPMSFYHDRHTILVSPLGPTIEDELAGREPMSQFQAILSQLGAEGIRALTPQAKGRIERMWKTLQDRLRKEMRLAGVKTIEEANAFLPTYIERYNARFGVEAREQETAWVQPDSGVDLPYLFAAKEERTVRADHTLAWRGKTLLIQRKQGQRSLAGVRVHVHTTPEGECFVYHAKERLTFKQIIERPKSPAVVRAAKPAGPKPALTSEQAELEQQQLRSARRKQMHFVHQGAGPCRPRLASR